MIVSKKVQRPPSAVSIYKAYPSNALNLIATWESGLLKLCRGVYT